jgi:hypothetical protein
VGGEWDNVGQGQSRSGYEDLAATDIKQKGSSGMIIDALPSVTPVIPPPPAYVDRHTTC